MIFPDLPKHYQWMQTAPELVQNRTAEVHTVQAPLQGFAGMTVDEWFDQHGYSVGPAAGSARNPEEPIDWLARDAWEFYALCIGMLCWIVYWYGVHMGAW